MKVRRSVSGFSMLLSCSWFWLVGSIRACCVGCVGCSSFLLVYSGLGVQRMISVLSACFHAVWSRPSSPLACRGSGCLIAASYSARSSSRLRGSITSMEMLNSCFCVLANFRCLNGLYVVLDFLAVVAVDLLMASLLRCFVTDWFQMLFEINSIFFGNTAFWGGTSRWPFLRDVRCAFLFFLCDDVGCAFLFFFLLRTGRIRGSPL
jgi:hypothetical protein